MKKFITTSLLLALLVSTAFTALNQAKKPSGAATSNGTKTSSAASNGKSSSSSGPSGSASTPASPTNSTPMVVAQVTKFVDYYLTTKLIDPFQPYYLTSGDIAYERPNRRYSGVNSFNLGKTPTAGYQIKPLMVQSDVMIPGAPTQKFTGVNVTIRGCVGTNLPLGLSGQQLVTAYNTKICNGNELVVLKTQVSTTGGAHQIVPVPASNLTTGPTTFWASPPKPTGLWDGLKQHQKKSSTANSSSVSSSSPTSSNLSSSANKTSSASSSANKTSSASSTSSNSSSSANKSSSAAPAPPKPKTYMYTKDQLKCNDMLIQVKNWTAAGCLAQVDVLSYFVISILNNNNGTALNFPYNNSYGTTVDYVTKAPFFFIPMASTFGLPVGAPPRYYLLVKSRKPAAMEGGFIKLYRVALKANPPTFSPEILLKIKEIQGINQQFALNLFQPFTTKNIQKQDIPNFPGNSTTGSSGLGASFEDEDEDEPLFNINDFSTSSGRFLGETIGLAKKAIMNMIRSNNPEAAEKLEIAFTHGLGAAFEGGLGQHNKTSNGTGNGTAAGNNTHHSPEYYIDSVVLNGQIGNTADEKGNYQLGLYLTNLTQNDTKFTILKSLVVPVPGTAGSIMGSIPILLPNYPDPWDKKVNFGHLILLTNKQINVWMVDTINFKLASQTPWLTLNVPCDFSTTPYIFSTTAGHVDKGAPYIVVGASSKGSTNLYEKGMIINHQTGDFTCIDQLNVNFFFDMIPYVPKAAPPKRSSNSSVAPPAAPMIVYQNQTQFDLQNNQFARNYNTFTLGLNTAAADTQGVVSFMQSPYNYLVITAKDIKTSPATQTLGLRTVNPKQTTFSTNLTATAMTNPKATSVLNLPLTNYQVFTDEVSTYLIGPQNAYGYGVDYSLTGANPASVATIDYATLNKVNITKPTGATEDGYDQIWPLNQNYLLTIKNGVQDGQSYMSRYSVYQCNFMSGPSTTGAAPGCTFKSSRLIEATNRTIAAFTLYDKLVLVFDSNEGTVDKQYWNIMRAFDINDPKLSKSGGRDGVWAALTTTAYPGSGRNSDQYNIRILRIAVSKDASSAYFVYAADGYTGNKTPYVFYLKVALDSKTAQSFNVQGSSNQGFVGANTLFTGDVKDTIITQLDFTKTTALPYPGTVPKAKLMQMLKAYNAQTRKPLAYETRPYGPVGQAAATTTVNNGYYNTGQLSQNYGLPSYNKFDKYAHPGLQKSLSGRGLITCISKKEIIYYYPFQKKIFVSYIRNGQQKSVFNYDLTGVRRFLQTECHQKLGIFQALAQLNNGTIELHNYRLGASHDVRTTLHSAIQLTGSPTKFRSFSEPDCPYLTTTFEGGDNKYATPAQIVTINTNGPNIVINTNGVKAGSQSINVKVGTATKALNLTIESYQTTPTMSVNSGGAAFPANITKGQVVDVDNMVVVNGPVVDLTITGAGSALSLTGRKAKKFAWKLQASQVQPVQLKRLRNWLVSVDAKQGVSVMYDPSAFSTKNGQYDLTWTGTQTVGEMYQSIDGTCFDSDTCFMTLITTKTSTSGTDRYAYILRLSKTDKAVVETVVRLSRTAGKTLSIPTRVFPLDSRNVTVMYMEYGSFNFATYVYNANNKNWGLKAGNLNVAYNTQITPIRFQIFPMNTNNTKFIVVYGDGKSHQLLTSTFTFNAKTGGYDVVNFQAFNPLGQGQPDSVPLNFKCNFAITAGTLTCYIDIVGLRDYFVQYTVDANAKTSADNLFSQIKVLSNPISVKGFDMIDMQATDKYYFVLIKNKVPVTKTPPPASSAATKGTGRRRMLDSSTPAASGTAASSGAASASASASSGSAAPAPAAGPDVFKCPYAIAIYKVAGQYPYAMVTCEELGVTLSSQMAAFSVLEVQTKTYLLHTTFQQSPTTSSRRVLQTKNKPQGAPAIQARTVQGAQVTVNDPTVDLSKVSVGMQAPDGQVVPGKSLADIKSGAGKGSSASTTSGASGGLGIWLWIIIIVVVIIIILIILLLVCGKKKDDQVAGSYTLNESSASFM